MKDHADERPRTFRSMFQVVRTVPVAMHVILDADPIQELLLEQIALVQEQHDRRLREQFRRHDRLPEHETVLEAVDAPVLGQPLVEAADGGEEDDGVAIVEIGVPCIALGARATNIVYAPFGS